MGDSSSWCIPECQAGIHALDSYSQHYAGLQMMDKIGFMNNLSIKLFWQVKNMGNNVA